MPEARSLCGSLGSSVGPWGLELGNMGAALKLVLNKLFVKLMKLQRHLHFFTYLHLEGKHGNQDPFQEKAFYYNHFHFFLSLNILGCN